MNLDHKSLKHAIVESGCIELTDLCDLISDYAYLPDEGTFDRMYFEASSLRFGDIKRLKVKLREAAAQIAKVECRDPSRWYHDVLVDTLGPWVNYWDFAQSADTYGDSLTNWPYKNHEDTITQVVNAVFKWRDIIMDLSVDFESIIERTEGLGLAHTIEIAAAQLLRYSEVRISSKRFSYGFETWYRPFLQVMKWFVPRLGATGRYDGRLWNADKMETLIENIIYDRRGFSSYTVSETAANFMGKEVANAIHDQEFDEEIDSTQDYLHWASDLENSTYPSLVPNHLKDAVVEHEENDTDDCDDKDNRQNSENIEITTDSDEVRVHDAHLDFINTVDAKHDSRSRERELKQDTNNSEFSLPSDEAKSSIHFNLTTSIIYSSGDENEYQIVHPLLYDPHSSQLRSSRMRLALALCRAHALGYPDGSTSLTLERLSSWMRIVLGLGLREVSLRKHDSYAKEGMERYPYYKDFALQMKRLVSRYNHDIGDENDYDGNEHQSLSSEQIAKICNNACCAFLDICFFHPFYDGNSRLARLVFDYILTRAGLCLSSVGALFTTVKRADDLEGARSFVKVVTQRVMRIPKAQEVQWVLHLVNRPKKKLEQEFKDSQLRHVVAKLEQTSITHLDPNFCGSNHEYRWFDCCFIDDSQDGLTEVESLDKPLNLEPFLA